MEIVTHYQWAVWFFFFFSFSFLLLLSFLGRFPDLTEKCWIRGEQDVDPRSKPITSCFVQTSYVQYCQMKRLLTNTTACSIKDVEK